MKFEKFLENLRNTSSKDEETKKAAHKELTTLFNNTGEWLESMTELKQRFSKQEQQRRATT